LRELVYIFI